MLGHDMLSETSSPGVLPPVRQSGGSGKLPRSFPASTVDPLSTETRAHSNLVCYDSYCARNRRLVFDFRCLSPCFCT